MQSVRERIMPNINMCLSDYKTNNLKRIIVTDDFHKTIKRLESYLCNNDNQ